jgi:hypothetical protein
MSERLASTGRVELSRGTLAGVVLATARSDTVGAGARMLVRQRRQVSTEVVIRAGEGCFTPTRVTPGAAAASDATRGALPSRGGRSGAHCSKMSAHTERFAATRCSRRFDVGDGGVDA